MEACPGAAASRATGWSRVAVAEVGEQDDDRSVLECARHIEGRDVCRPLDCPTSRPPRAQA